VPRSPSGSESEVDMVERSEISLTLRSVANSHSEVQRSPYQLYRVRQEGKKRGTNLDGAPLNKRVSSEFCGPVG
jgi:hypothetical protein